MITKLLFYEMLTKSKVYHYFRNKNVPYFLTKHSKSLFDGIIFAAKSNRSPKYFKITDTTRKRIAKIPTEKVKSDNFQQLSDKNGEVGLVYFNDYLHYMYYISKTGIYIAISKSKGKLGHGNDGSLTLAQSIIGFIYINFTTSESIEPYIGHELDMPKHKNHLMLKAPYYMDKSKKLLRVMEKYGED